MSRAAAAPITTRTAPPWCSRGRGAGGRARAAARLMACFALGAPALPTNAPAQPAGAQSNAPAQPVARYDDAIEVRLVDLDALVTDRAGRSLDGLEPRDFRLSVDGRRVAVDRLLRVGDYRATVTERLTLVAFLDLRHLQRAHQRRAVERIAEALRAEMAAAPTWAMVVSFDDGLRLEAAPTRDAERAAAALRQAVSREPAQPDLRRQQQDSMNVLRETLRMLADPGSSYRLGTMAKRSTLLQLRSFGERLTRDTLETAAALETTIQALAFVPGRKALLFVTDGIPLKPLDRAAKTVHDRLFGARHRMIGDDIVEEGPAGIDINDRNARPTGSDRIDSLRGSPGVVQDDDGGALDFERTVAGFDLTDRFVALGAMANTRRVTIYPLKPPVADAATAGLAERAADRDSVRGLSDVLLALDLLASETGGEAMVAEGSVARFLARAREDLGAHYALAFDPPEDAAGGPHRIELSVKRRGALVRHRRSYLVQSLEARLADRAWGTLLLDWTENLHGAELAVERTALVGDGFGVDLMLSLPIERLDLQPAGELLRSDYLAVTQLRAEDGTRLAPLPTSFTVSIPAADAARASGQLFGVRLPIQLPGGRYRLALGLWEASTGKASFLLADLDVGAGGGAQLAATGPASPGACGVAAALAGGR
jgi:VWFA-related protein